MDTLELQKIIATRQNSAAESAAPPTSLDYGELAVDINGVLRTGNKNKEVVTHIVDTDERLTNDRNPRVTNLTNQDLNVITTPGFYYADSGNTVTNKPSGIDAFGLLVEQTAGGYKSQLLIGGNNSPNKMFTRQYTGTSWGAWSSFYTTAYKPTPAEIGAATSNHTHLYLPLSGGTMTGAITLSSDPIANLHAATKQYVDSKIAASGSGDMLKSVYDTDEDGVVDKAEKLGTARTITLGTAAVSTATSFDGSQNITIPVTEIKESYLTWGGKNVAGAITPIDAALADFSSGNRLFGTPASSISVEVSRDGGSTWSAYPEITDDGKRRLVSTETEFYLGGVKSDNTTQDQLRVTIAADSFYFSCRKVLMNVSTNGATSMKVNIKYSTIGTPDIFKDRGTFSLNGWSGWNSIPLSTLWGGGLGQTTQTKKIQFTFTVTKVGLSSAKVLSIYAYGENAWGVPSVMAKYGRSYNVDYDCNSTFEGKVTLKQDPSSNLEAATKQYVDKGAISTYTHSKTGTVHTLTGSGDNIRFVATADFTSGDTFKIGTSAVTAKTIGGDSLWTGFFKKDSVVTCYKNGTTITFNGGGLPSTEAAKLTPENIKTGISITANGKTVNGTFTADGTAAAGDMLAGKVAYVNGQKVTGTIPGNPAEVNLDPPRATDGGLIYDFNDVNTYYTSGYYWSPNEDIVPAIELTSDKLKAGEKVLGVTGSFTADANATADDILSGKTAYVGGNIITGTMTNYGGITNAVSSVFGEGSAGAGLYIRINHGAYLANAESGYPEVFLPYNKIDPYRGAWQSAGGIGFGTDYIALNSIPSGFYYSEGNGWAPEVRTSKSGMASAIGLTADKIVSGNTILGIAGTGGGDPSIAATDVSYWGNYYKTVEVDARTNRCFAIAICAGTDYYTTVKITLRGWNGSSWVEIESQSDYSGTSKKDPQAGMSRWATGYSKYQLEVSNDRNVRGLILGVLVGF